MERRTVALRDEDWRVIYETAVWLTMQQGRHVSLAKAMKVVLGELKRQDWFRKNSQALLKALAALGETKEVPDAESLSGTGDRATRDGG